MVTLYRKYRPQKFSEIVDEEHIKVTLQNEIASGKIAHAYLFCGPRGVGKTTIARIFAKAINCEKRVKGEAEPCNKCKTCEDISKGKSLDILEIDAASHTGVDNVRENIINSTRISPSKLKYKVFIIDEVHMLSLSAFNALLKTLEEPPENVIFILVTTEVHKVPLTIISRCQRFDFKKVGLEDLKKRLKFIIKEEEIKVEDEVITSVARHSGGCVRDAESLLGQILTLATFPGEKIKASQAELVIPRSNFCLVQELAGYLIKSQTKEALNLINNLQKSGIDLEQFTRDLIEFFRKLLIIKISGEIENIASELSKREESEILDLRNKIQIGNIVLMLNLFMEKLRELRFASIAQLPLELAIVEICEKTRVNKVGDAKTQKEQKREKDKVDEIKKEKVGDRFIKPSGEKKIPDKILGAEKESKNVVGLKEIQDNWGKVLEEAKKYNRSLFFILKLAEPLTIKDDVLELSFEYKIHAERIRERKDREIIEKILRKVTGEILRVEPVIRKKGEIPRETSQENILSKVLKAFGGRVVE